MKERKGSKQLLKNLDKNRIDRDSPVEIGVPTPENTVWFTMLKRRKLSRQRSKVSENIWIAFDRDDGPSEDIFISPNAQAQSITPKGRDKILESHLLQIGDPSFWAIYIEGKILHDLQKL